MYQYYPEYQYQLFTPSIREELETNFFRSSFEVKMPSQMPKMFWRTYGMSKDVQADIFHGLSNEIPLGLKKVKKVVTIHDLIFKHFPSTYSIFDRWMYDQKSRYACKNADLIIAISESTKRDIVRFYSISEDRIKVIYQSCHPIYYQKNNTDRIAVKNKFNLPNEFILSVGSVIERKNILNVAKALLQLKDKDIPPLIIIGKGKAYKKKVQQFIIENKLEKNVFFLEKEVNGLELKAIYEMANLLVYPSVCEGFGLPVAEALLCQTPVLTSNVSSLPEAAGKHSLLINPMDINEMAFSIQNILQNTEQQKTMKEKGYEYAMNHFNPKKVTKQLAKHYQDLI